jgi:uncharacterized protein HemX
MNPLLQHLSWPARLGVGAVMILSVGAAVVLSAVFFALFLLLGLVAGGWLWWQNRRLQREVSTQFVKAEYEVVAEADLLEDSRNQDQDTSINKQQSSSEQIFPKN